jgi:hypothetical protein
MMETMNTASRNHLRSTTRSATDTAAVEQLTLLPTTTTPARFRLSNDTRERGLRHVAEIRQRLAASTGQPTLAEAAPRHDAAA